MVQILFALVLWGVSLGAKGHAFLGRAIKKLFWGTVFLFFTFDAVLLWQQYRLWGASELGKFLLPNYQGNYFFLYSLYRILAPHIIALIVALALIYVTTRLNKKRGYVLFEKEEPYLAGLSIFLVGYPGWLIFIVFFLITYLIWQLIISIKLRKSNVRLPLYSLWPLLALVTVVFVEVWLSNTDLWKFLQI